MVWPCLSMSGGLPVWSRIVFKCDAHRVHVFHNVEKIMKCMYASSQTHLTFILFVIYTLQRMYWLIFETSTP